MNTLEQVEKLAKTLIKSGLESNPAEATKKAREMLNVTHKEEPVDIGKLPKLEDMKPVSKTQVDLNKDKSLKDMIEEDAEKIYNKQKTSSK